MFKYLIFKIFYNFRGQSCHLMANKWCVGSCSEIQTRENSRSVDLKQGLKVPVKIPRTFTLLENRYVRRV